METQSTLSTKDTNSKPFSWKNYNYSQTKEKPLFLKLLKELCATINHAKIRRLIFSICVKQYSMKSARRTIGELELCQKAGFVDKVVHFNTMLHGMNRNSTTHILNDLIHISALPLRSIERKFCCDSTGFGLATLHDRWSIARQQYSKHHKYMKAHIAFGTLTNVVVSCKITEANKADAPILPELVDQAKENFIIEEWSADKGYLSRNNYEAIAKAGALPLIPFKSNVTSHARGSAIWKEMFLLFKNNQTLFMKKYHLRSNAESGIFMIKQRFGDLTMMKHDVGCINDLLSKILCHNLCVLIQEMFLLGIEVNFAHDYKEVAHV